MLGHLRGGPAKAAVVSSGLTGLVSGSSIANVVMTGTFTIPLMRRVGFSREKAGAVEVSGSVNGQIMPPVMGAAAFLMVEYIGIPYTEVIRHAFLPAVISYIALLYIVHLEAVKVGMRMLEHPRQRSFMHSTLIYGITVCSILILAGAVYYGLGWVKEATPEHALKLIIGLLSGCYIGLLWYASRFPPLQKDDPKAPIYKLPLLAPTVKTGLHFILPLCLLVWCLMIERLSPGLSAFWACFALIIMLLTQRPLLAIFHKEWGEVASEAFVAFKDLLEGMQIGSRNMVGIGVATATAGVIVGVVSQTGIGQVMTEVVEMLSGGSFILVLVYTAFICIILGMGLPTTANYIVVASIMVPVIQELGALHGMFIPLIAIHLFVFYFGIMADVTPPVGLASSAAAAVSGGDPIRTGLQAFLYSSRTVILPFFFIFNHELLLIGVESFGEGVWVFCLYLAAILIFVAATQGYFIAKSQIHESIVLFLIATMLFIPQGWLNLLYPAYESVAPTELEAVLKKISADGVLHIQLKTEDVLGDEKLYYAHLPVVGDTLATKKATLGMNVAKIGKKFVVEDTAFMGAAEKAGVQFEDEVMYIRSPLEQPEKRSVYMVALLLLGSIAAMQWFRRRKPKPKRSRILVSDE